MHCCVHSMQDFCLTIGLKRVRLQVKSTSSCGSHERRYHATPTSWPLPVVLGKDARANAHALTCTHAYSITHASTYTSLHKYTRACTYAAVPREVLHNAWVPLQLHSDHLARILKCRALVRLLRGYQSSGMPGFVNCPGTDPLGGGDWRRHCSNLAWSQALQFLSIFAPVYNAYSWMPSSHQPGWLEQM